MGVAVLRSKQRELRRRKRVLKIGLRVKINQRVRRPAGGKRQSHHRTCGGTGKKINLVKQVRELVHQALDQGSHQRAADSAAVESDDSIRWHCIEVYLDAL